MHVFIRIIEIARRQVMNAAMQAPKDCLAQKLLPWLGPVGFSRFGLPGGMPSWLPQCLIQ